MCPAAAPVAVPSLWPLQPRRGVHRAPGSLLGPGQKHRSVQGQDQKGEELLTPRLQGKGLQPRGAASPHPANVPAAEREAQPSQLRPAAPGRGLVPPAQPVTLSHPPSCPPHLSHAVSGLPAGPRLCRGVAAHLQMPARPQARTPGPGSAGEESLSGLGTAVAETPGLQGAGRSHPGAECEGVRPCLVTPLAAQHSRGRGWHCRLGTVHCNTPAGYCSWQGWVPQELGAGRHSPVP